MMQYNDPQNDTRLVRRRIWQAVGIVGALALLLLARLAWLQVFEHERFDTLARENHVRFSPLAPVRGVIYDRNGAVLAENRPVYHLEILPEQVKDLDELLAQLGRIVALSAEDLERFQGLLRRGWGFEWQTLRTNLSETEAARVALHLHRHSGVALRAHLQRHYPHGEATAHVVGYVGRVGPDDLTRIDKQAYRGLSYIGRSGIESQYEDVLRGWPGFERVEINAHGKAVRSLGETAPDSGQSVHLSLDLGLQQRSLTALQSYEGAVVAMVPRTGEVLAFAASPGFDPNPFVGGISKTDYEALRTSETRPLLNRALYGRYAPGSTIKGFLLLVGMENGVDTERRVLCPGWYSLPGHTHRYRDWKRGGHGWVAANDGIVQSCDVYFYRLARQLGIDRMHDGMTRFGFGKRTGIDLPGEPSGLMPSRDWKQNARGQAWFPGETVITGIGQGYMLVTPLQLAAATATLANRGRRVLPQFLKAVENPQTKVRREAQPKYAEQVELQRADGYEYVIRSMRDVVHGPRGTARRIGRDIPYEMAGKTGTAQVKSIGQNEEYDKENVEKRFADHSLFVAFAPVDDPQIAIAVVVEHAGSGSATAAPIARELMDYYLVEKLGMFAPEAPPATPPARPSQPAPATPAPRQNEIAAR